jgi:hypothetical protein
MDERELRSLRALTNEVRALRQEIRAVHEDQQANENAKYNKPVQPPSVEVTTTPQLDPARREYYEAENHDRKSLWRGLKPWLETVGICIALALAIFNLFALSEIQRQTPSVIGAASTAGDALKKTVEQFRVDERACVEIDSISKSADPPAQGFPPSFRYRVFLKNVGNTIARDAFLRRVTYLGAAPNLQGVKMAQEQLLKPNEGKSAPVPPYPLPSAFAPNAILPIPFTLGGSVPQYVGFYSSSSVESTIQMRFEFPTG